MAALVIDTFVTAGPVGFTLVNQNGEQALVAGQVNTLTLTLTNNTADPMTLEGGPVVPEKDAPSGPSSLYFSFGDLLDDAALKAIGLSAPSWTPAAGFLGIARDDTFTLPAHSTQVFTLANVKAPSGPRPGQLTIDYYNIGTVTDSSGLSLPVRRAAGGHDKPDIGASWVDTNAVTITTDPAHPVANTLTLTIANASRTTALVPADVPWGSNPPVFQLWWVCGARPGYGALTTKELAGAITVTQTSQYGDTWKPDPNRQADPPYWSLLPQDHEVIGTGESASVQLTIANIVTPLEPGVTVLYLQYVNIPGYDDGFVSPPLTIQKNLPPTIVSFSSDRRIVSFDQGGVVITFSWQIENARRLTISNTGHIETSPFPTTFNGSLPVTVRGPGVYILQASAGTVDDGPTASIEIIRLADYLTGRTVPVVAVSEWPDWSCECDDMISHCDITGQVAFPSVSSAALSATLTGYDLCKDDGSRFPYPPQTVPRSGAWSVSGMDVYINAPEGQVHLVFSETNGNLTLVTSLFTIAGRPVP